MGIDYDKRSEQICQSDLAQDASEAESWGVELQVKESVIDETEDNEDNSTSDGFPRDLFFLGSLIQFSE